MKTLEQHLNEVRNFLIDSKTELNIGTLEKVGICYPIPSLGRITLSEDFTVSMVRMDEKLEKCELTNIIPVTDIRYGQVIGIEKSSGIPYFLIIDKHKTTYITPVFKKHYDEIELGKREMPSIAESEFQLFLFQISSINDEKEIVIELPRPLYFIKDNVQIILTSEPVSCIGTEFIKVTKVKVKECSIGDFKESDICFVRQGDKLGIRSFNRVLFFDNTCGSINESNTYYKLLEIIS